MHRVTKVTDVSDTCVVQTRKSNPSSEREGDGEREEEGEGVGEGKGVGDRIQC